MTPYGIKRKRGWIIEPWENPKKAEAHLKYTERQKTKKEIAFEVYNYFKEREEN